MSRRKTSKNVALWIAQCLCKKIKGGKTIISTRSKKDVNWAAAAMRKTASTLLRSKSALGTYYRRHRAMLEISMPLTESAYKIAKIVYSMLGYKNVLFKCRAE